MVKYEVQHGLVKELGLKGDIAQLADSTMDHLGHMLDNADLKDLAFFTSWATMSFLLVQSGVIKELMAAGGKLEKFATQPGVFTNVFGQWNIFQMSGNFAGYIVQMITGRNPYGPEYKATPEQQQQDYDILIQIGLALVISYFVLAQGADIASAVLTLGGKI